MIDVQVAPAKPIAIRHQPKEWMRVPIKISFRAREAFNDRQQLFSILFKLQRLGTANILVHLWSRRHAVRPGDGRVERKPFHNTAMKHISG